HFRPGPVRSGMDELRIVAVGDLLWVKGHEYALEALRALLDAGVPARLDILGGDPDPGTGEHSQRPKLRNAIHDLGLDGRAHLHGEVSHAELRARLHAAATLLHPRLSVG